MPDALDTTDTVAAPIAQFPVAATSDDWEICNAGSNVYPRRRKDAKDWAPLRALAQKRARIELHTVWEDAAKGQRISAVRFRRFCYRDYAKKHKSLAVIEQPYSLSLKLDTLQPDGKKGVLYHYCASVKGGRLAFYARHGSGPKAVVRHAWPFQLDLTAPIACDYPEVEARFSKRLTRMLRAKARANGVKLPPGDDLKAVLTAGLWPALATVKAHHLSVRGSDWAPGQDDRWLMRHFRCAPADLPRKVTGYGSKVVTRLFWEAMRPWAPGVTLPSGGGVQPSPLWSHKWNWLALLRTWLNVDHTQQILRAPKIAQWDNTFTKDPAAVRRLLKQWEPKRVVRMLTETAADNSTIRDTIGMLERRKVRLEQEGRRWMADHEGGEGPIPAMPAPEAVPRTRDVVELHDWLSTEQQRAWQRETQERERLRLAAMTPEQRAAIEEREKRERAPFEHSEELRAVDGKQVEVDGVVHTIVLPFDTAQLQLWGQTLHNCIGGYTYAAREGRIFGVRTEGAAGGGKPIHWGIELNGGQIAQLRGVCNADAPLDLRASVERVLKDAKLIERLTVGQMTAHIEDAEGLRQLLEAAA